MGYNLELSGSEDGEHATDLCTAGGYSALCDWIETLPESDFPAVRKLANEGMFEGTDTLARQLNGAIYGQPPDDPDTLDVANRLADLLGKGYSAETVSITS